MATVEAPGQLGIRPFNEFDGVFDVVGKYYFPSVGEILVTVGLVSFEILGYIAIVKYFPILSAQPRPAAGR